MNPFSDNPTLTLLAEGAVFVAASGTLVLADVHLGKSAAFRAKGLPVPEGDTARDLQRMLDLARNCRASHLVVAGDLFHAPAGITPELEAALGEFLRALGIPVTLVVGNHDLKLKQLPGGIVGVSHLDLEGNLRVVHDPVHAAGDRLHVSGHWHPVVKIPDGRRTSLRLPCFLFRNRTLVLPAFGSFTGGAVLAAGPDDRVFVALREKVVELPAALMG